MADYFSRYPSPSHQNNQIKELWNNWFTVNKIDNKKIVLDQQKRQEVTKQPIREKMTGEEKVTGESERTAGVESERENELCKQERKTLKGIIASICNQDSSGTMNDE